MSPTPNNTKLSNLKQRLLGSQLFKDSFWSLAGNVIGRGLSLVAGIAVARFLGKDIYGEYGIIRNTILTIGIFSTFGLGYTATKYVAEYKRYKPELTRVFIRTANKITLWFSGAMALILFLFAHYVADKWLDAIHLATPLRILSVIVVFNAITTTQIGILSGFGRFKTIARVNSIIGVLTFLFSVILTWFFGLNGALLALLIVQVVNTLLNYFYVKKETSHLELLENDRKLTQEVLRFSTPIALQEAVYSITGWLASVLLIKFTTYGELGMYSAAMQWNAIILFIPGILRNVILSHLSSHSSDNKAHQQILKQTVMINFVSTLIPIIFVFLFSGLIAKTYGASFVGLSTLISLAAFTTLFTSVSNVYAQAFTSLGRNWTMLLIRTLRDVSKLAGMVIFVQYFNVPGVKSMIYSGLIAGASFLLIMVLLYNKFIKNND